MVGTMGMQIAIATDFVPYLEESLGQLVGNLGERLLLAVELVVPDLRLDMPFES